MLDHKQPLDPPCDTRSQSSVILLQDYLAGHQIPAHPQGLHDKKDKLIFEET